MSQISAMLSKAENTSPDRDKEYEAVMFIPCTPGGGGPGEGGYGGETDGEGAEERGEKRRGVVGAR